MDETPRGDSPRWQRWQALLVRVQLLARGSCIPETQPGEGSTWQARLIRAGVSLAWLGGLALASWLRRHL